MDEPEPIGSPAHALLPLGEGARFVRELRDFRDRMNAELGRNARPMELHGAFADTQVSGDLLVQFPAQYMREHLALAISQLLES